MISKKILIISLCLIFAKISAQKNQYKDIFPSPTSRWVDSVYRSMTPDERIAQLFMVAAYSDRKKQDPKELEKLITKYKIGGLIFFQGGPVRQANLTNHYQKLSKTPLLISIDAEWGLSMRLDSTPSFPRQMTLGAIQKDTLIYEMGREIARECRRLGIHVNFAPVADVNNNTENPVIGVRSFGENKYDVARKASLYMKGLQDEHVLANAKHFPGHGDTDSDSHKTLPIINSSKERIDSLELYPFKQLINQGLGSMMVAHLFIPAIDTTNNRASTLSKKVVADLLRTELGFKGLIFTDALNMKGVSSFYKPGEVDVKALIAGNDVLLFAENVPKAIAEIKKAIKRKEITLEEIDRHCKKILAVKYWTGLNKYKPIDLKNLYEDLNNPHADYINRMLTEKSLTLLQNKNNILPLRKLDTLKIASLSLGYKRSEVFQKALNDYAPVNHFGLDKDADSLTCDSIIRTLKQYNLVIIALNNTNNNPKKDFGLTPTQLKVLNAITAQQKTIVSVFSNPYCLAKLTNIDKVDAIILSYEYNNYTQSITPQLIFGGINAEGKLPVTASLNYKRGLGLESAQAIRFKYSSPEELGIDTKVLDKIDSIALMGIEKKAYPGCQILVAKDGKVFYRKSFGYHTYDNKTPVKNEDIYDLASLTKIMATTPSLMRLVQEKKINFDDSLVMHLPQLKGTNKSSLTLRQMLTHQAGLKDWIPFWTKTVAMRGEYKPNIYSYSSTDLYSVRIADHLFINKTYRDTIYNRIIESKIDSVKKYKYSDLGYYFHQLIIEDKKKMPLDKYVNEAFYKPLGLSTMGYLPLDKFPLNRIPPTEDDKKFRKQLVHGYVHDQGAAMLGGVSGHAGVFADANDVAVMMQMFMQKGQYGGVQIIDSAVVNECTKCQYCISGESENRRAIGFDKPETNPDKESPVCSCVSYLSFGHSGYTGTLAWADPDKNLVYIFLSNRVNPDADPNKLTKLGIRTKIQEVIYEAVK